MPVFELPDEAATAALAARIAVLARPGDVPMWVVHEQPDDGYRLCAFLWWKFSYHARTSTEV